MNDQSPAPAAPLTNVEAEAAFLGALMVENRLIGDLGHILEQSDFSEPLHGRIYRVILKFFAAGKLANPVTLRPVFDMDPAMKEVGGFSYLAALTGSGAGVIGAKDFAEQVRDLARLREVRDSVERGLAAISDDGNLEDFLSEIEVATAKASTTLRAIPVYSTGDMIGMAEDRAEASLQTGVPGASCKTIPDLDSLLGKLEPKQMTILAGRPGMGKAQPLDAAVLTRNGWSTMGALKVGDRLASIDGHESVVTHVHERGERQVYRVTMSDGRSTECCGDHLWEVMYRDWPHARIINTDRLRKMLTRVRYTNRLSVRRFSGQFGPDRHLPIDPWLLGFLLGDGCFQQGAVSFSTIDPEIVEQVVATVPEDVTVYPIGKNNFRITVPGGGPTRNLLVQAIRSMGLEGTRSHTKFIPVDYMEASRGQRIQLLRGLMDSDGWAETFGAVRFATASERMAEQVQALIRSIGGVCSIRPKDTTYTVRGVKKAGKTSFMCRIRLDDPAEVFTLIRKSSRCGRTRNALQLNVRSVEPSRTAETRCITVSHPSSLYVTDDFIATHNSTTAMSAMLGYAFNGHPAMYALAESSAEMFSLKLTADLLHAMAKPVPFLSLKQGILSKEQRRDLIHAREIADTLPIKFAHIGRSDVKRLEALVAREFNRLKRDGRKLEVVLVDYLQLLTADGRHRAGDDRGRINAVSESLLGIAQRYDCHVIALSQLSRAVEAREDKRPRLSDLRESGRLEEDCDNCVMVYREEYYLERAKPTDEKLVEAWQADMDRSHGKVELIAAKTRFGSTASKACNFFGEFSAVRGSGYYGGSSVPDDDLFNSFDEGAAG